MRYREFRYHWQFDCKSRPEDLWSLVSDTDRFNRDADLPSVELLNDSATAKEGRRRVRVYKFGVRVEWEEFPFEWVRPHRFSVVRQHVKGPLKELRLRVELTPRDEGGTHLDYKVWVTPRNLFGFVATPIQVGFLSARSFARAISKYDDMAMRGESPIFQTDESNAHFAPGGRERLAALSQKLIEQGAPPDIVQRLKQVIEDGDDLTLARMRSHSLADFWGVPRHAMLEVCLMATRIGLLDLEWDMICPHCRGAAETCKSLSGIRSDAHCDSCKIDFSVNFEHTVELTFSPNSAVRHIEKQTFCIGGPQMTPHIIAQQLLAPNAERTLTLPLETGRYRLRVSDFNSEQFLRAIQDGEKTLTLEANEHGFSNNELEISTQPELCLKNATESERIFMIERMTWSDKAATAAEVTALQMFRDLFANEALRPGEQISVGTMTILFTDLKGSTKLYREIGDAPAFGRVMNHFDVLRECIAEEDGALVKTIGDAVMAVFRRPSSALRSILKAQKILAAPPDGSLPLHLKVGIHAGASIAVTLNGRLDYFGGTVNLAARLEGLSKGDDAIISSTVHADPEVAALLTNAQSGFTAEKFYMQLKGFDEEQFELWRVKQHTI